MGKRKRMMRDRNQSVKEVAPPIKKTPAPTKVPTKAKAPAKTRARTTRKKVAKSE